MDIVTPYLVIGIILIIIGLLVVRFPMLISGYNTMPKEERKKVDIHGFSRLMRKVFCIMGGILILVPPLLQVIGLSKWNDALIFLTPFGGIGYLLFREKSFRQGMPAGYKKGASTQSKIFSWIGVVTTVVVFGGCFYVGMPAKIAVQENRLTISGAYGATIPIETITNVEVRDQLPPIGMRTNGLSFMSYHKGHFQVKDLGGDCLFYLHSGKGPYLIVLSKDNPPVIINRSTTEEIQQLYDQLRPIAVE